MLYERWKYKKYFYGGTGKQKNILEIIFQVQMYQFTNNDVIDAKLCDMRSSIFYINDVFDVHAFGGSFPLLSVCVNMHFSKRFYKPFFLAILQAIFQSHFTNHFSKPFLYHIHSRHCSLRALVILLGRSLRALVTSFTPRAPSNVANTRRCTLEISPIAFPNHSIH